MSAKEESYYSRITQRRKPGRPVGAKTIHRKKKSIYKNEEKEEKEQQQPTQNKKIENEERSSYKKKTRGRPEGSKNTQGYKSKPAPKTKQSFANLYMNATGVAADSKGNILQLLNILQTSVRKNWTDKNILNFFQNKTPQQMEEEENVCHFYSSSKGCIVSSQNELPDCKLFPDVKLTSNMLAHYIHSFDDVLTYGEFVSKTRTWIETRLISLLKQSQFQKIK